MHIVWFLLMVGSFMSILSNNVAVVVKKNRDPKYFESVRGRKELVPLLIMHTINYVIFYFALTNFIDHMLARF